MQAIYDHLQAIILAATVLLILAAVGQSTLEGVVGGTRFHASRVKQTAILSQIKQDLRNVGAGGATTPIVTYAEDELVIEAPPSQGEPVAEIGYVKTQEGTGPDGEPRYRLRRAVDGTITMETPLLTAWTVRCIDANGDTLAYGSSALNTDTRGLFVKLASSPPGEEENKLPQRWESVIYPYHLNN